MRAGRQKLTDRLKYACDEPVLQVFVFWLRSVTCLTLASILQQTIQTCKDFEKISAVFSREGGVALSIYRVVGVAPSERLECLRQALFPVGQLHVDRVTLHICPVSLGSLQVCRTVSDVEDPLATIPVITAKLGSTLRGIFRKSARR